MRQYLNLLQKILYQGNQRPDRTGTGTLSLFGEQLKFNLQDGFPLVTTKKIYIRSVVGELLWFLRGDTHIRWLNDNNIHIWDDWADPMGRLGPIYGYQWRKWTDTSSGYHRHIDQIRNVILDLKNDPFSRRHIVSAWNVSDLPDMALAPCHMMFQLYVTGDNRLSCHMYQRSADVFLGVPFNIASYALLTHMIAQVTDLGVGELTISFGDVHIYLNHLEQVNTQLDRNPRVLPELHLNPHVRDIDGFEIEDIELLDYFPLPAIPAPISV